jgi:ParB/RepB/Spo0J family partition protein
MATAVNTGTLTVELDKIHVPTNVRGLDSDHVDALAGSIALQGLLSPVTIAPSGAEHAQQGYAFDLVAGFHRYAAVTQLGHGVIDSVLRAEDGDMEQTAAAIAAARATENIARKQLNPYEEAVAVKAMRDSGLSADGAAQALGWSKAKVTHRTRLLELPVAAQRLIGDGILAVSAIETLRSIGAVSAEILDVTVKHLAGGGWGAQNFAHEPGRVVAEAIRVAEVFAAYLNSTDQREIEMLKLGKRAQADYDIVAELEKKLDRYAFGQPRVPFTDDDVDQARAAGVLLELAGSQPMVIDRGVYRELAKQAIKRYGPYLEARIIEIAASKSDLRAEERATAVPADPAQQAERDHGRQMRHLAEQAHNVNTDLGWSLRNGLSVIDTDDLDVARFFVYALFEGDAEDGYGTYGDRARNLAIRGVRLVIEEFRTDVTKTKKDNTRGALRMDYGNPQDSTATREWMWKYLQAAKTAGELYGRALVIISAEHYATGLVVPASQQHPPLAWSSRKGYAQKALAKLAGPHLPATLKALEKSVAKAKRDHDKTLAAIAENQTAAAAAAATAEPDGNELADVEGPVGDEVADINDDREEI